jgi:outer membrane lipoprotein SlyB
MRRFSAIVLTPCIFALFLAFLYCPAKVEAQQPAKPAYAPPPDLKIYFRPGPKERSISVTATNSNVPGVPANLTYLKQTYEMFEDIGFDIADNPNRAAIQVRATVSYNQVDNSQKVANTAGARAVTGAVAGALGGLMSGFSGRGIADSAAGGATAGAASAADQPLVQKYLTIDFEISSKKRDVQVGRVTKDITTNEMGPQELIDALIADYLEASLPGKKQ